MAEIVIDTPNPKQLEFLQADERYICYGGAKGGGKSWCVRAKAILLALSYSGIKILLLRRQLKELRDDHILKIQEMTAGVAVWRDSLNSFLFPTQADGKVSRILCGHCDTDADVASYAGIEYDVIFIDEATQFTEHQFISLDMSIRGTNDFPKRMYLTCNPGGVGHEWVKRLFIDKNFSPKENPDSYKFIPAKATDNHALMAKNPEYLAQLDRLPDGMREALRDGSWDSFLGQFLTEFDRNIHVMEPFAIPNHWRRYVTLDYGLDMTAAVWIAVDERGKSFVYRELYEKDLIISDAAMKIKEFSGTEKIYEHLAPPDLWSRGQESGKSRAEIFSENGLHLTKTSNSRISGWAAVKESFKIIKDEEGRADSPMKIFSVCLNLIRCLPKLQYSERNPGDVATEPHEITHAPDALRGFCIHRSGRTPELAGVPKPINFSFEKPSPMMPCGYGEKVMVI